MELVLLLVLGLGLLLVLVLASLMESESESELDWKKDSRLAQEISLARLRQEQHTLESDQPLQD